MINETLFNTENYDELRLKMVDELVTDLMENPIPTLLTMLEDHLMYEFSDFDDDTLQNMYDNLKADEK